MTERRIVVCFDLQAGRVVKGESFRALRELGDPIELALRAVAEGADEMVLLDIGASPADVNSANASPASGPLRYGTTAHGTTALDTARRITREVSVPVTLGGGIRAVDDVARALDAGAARVAINSAAVASPELITRAATRFGAERIMVSIDARRMKPGEEGGDEDGEKGSEECSGRDGYFQVYTQGGRNPTDLEAGAWARACVERGAGTLLVTSIDRDGRRDGFDLDLVRRVSAAIANTAPRAAPIIASGGAGGAVHFLDLFTLTGAAAGLGAGIFHDGTTTPALIKEYLVRAGIAVQNTGAPAGTSTGELR